MCVIFSNSVGLCYFISLSAVYGNSVALMRLQLKRVSFYRLPYVSPAPVYI